MPPPSQGIGTRGPLSSGGRSPDHGPVTPRSRPPRCLALFVAIAVLVAGLWPGAALAADPTSSELRAAERLVLTRINEERAERDLRAIRMDPRIAAVAQARSADMVARQYFAHVDPDGLAPWDHLAAADIGWSRAGEIIALDSRSPVSDAARGAVQQWMASPGHHDQIVSTTFNYAGWVSRWPVASATGPWCSSRVPIAPHPGRASPASRARAEAGAHACAGRAPTRAWSP